MRWIILFLLFLSGIIYAQQNPAGLCLEGLVTDSRFITIAEKVAINAVEDTTFAMLANQSLANERERKAISEWVTARAGCIKAGSAYLQQTYLPQIYAWIQESENSLLATAIELYNGKLSFGEFNRRRKATAVEIDNKLAALLQQEQARAQARQQAQQQSVEAQQATQQQAREAQEAQAELARQQAATQFLLNRMGQSQPNPFQIPMPPTPRPTVNTNCYQIGNQWNCTTR